MAQRTRQRSRQRQPRQAGRPVGRAAPSTFGGFKVRLSPSQVATILFDAGFKDDREAFDAPGYPEIAVAIAIAFAESRFYADATNRSSAGVAHGLFQIMQPELNPALLDGVTNARVAYRMYESDSGDGTLRFFGPWAGSQWRSFIDIGVQAAAARRGNNPSLGDNFRDIVGSIPNPLEAFDNVVDFLRVLFSGALWLRILLVLGGSVLLLIGLNQLLKQTTGVDAIGLAKTAATKGAL